MNGHLPPLSALARVRGGRPAEELQQGRRRTAASPRRRSAIRSTRSRTISGSGCSTACNRADRADRLGPAAVAGPVRGLRRHPGLGPPAARAQRHRHADGDRLAVDRRQVAGVAAAPLSGAEPGDRCADFGDRRHGRPDPRRFRPRDPLRHRPLSRARCRIAVAERGVPGVQPAPAGNRAAAAHARRSAASRADPRPGDRPRSAGADLGDVAEGGRGRRRSRRRRA